MNHNRSSGFTLVELLIFMGLFSVILVVLSSLFAAIIQQQLENQVISAVESDSTYVVSRLAYDFEQADTVVVPVENGDETVSLTLDINGEEYEYLLNDSTLEVVTPTDTVHLTSPRTVVTDLSFQRLGNESGVPTIRVRMTLSSLAENSTGAEVTEIDTIFGIR